MDSISRLEKKQTPENRLEASRPFVPSEQGEEEEDEIVIPPVRRLRRTLLKQHTAPPAAQEDVNQSKEQSSVSLAMRYMRQSSLPTSAKEVEAAKHEKDEDNTPLPAAASTTSRAAPDTEEPAATESKEVNPVDMTPERNDKGNEDYVADDSAAPVKETQHVEESTSADTDPGIAVENKTIVGDASIVHDSMTDDIASFAVAPSSISESDAKDAPDSLQDKNASTDIRPDFSEGGADDMNDSIVSDGDGSIREERSEANDLQSEQAVSSNKMASQDEVTAMIEHVHTPPISHSEAAIQVDLVPALVNDTSALSQDIKHVSSLSQSAIQAMIDTRVAVQLRDVKTSLQSFNKTITAQGAVVDHFQQRINSSLSLASDAASKYTWLSESLSILNHDYNVLYKSVNELHAQSQSTEYSIYAMINNVIGVVDNIVLKLDKQRDVDDIPAAGTLDEGIRAMVKELEEKVNKVFSMMQVLTMKSAYFQLIFFLENECNNWTSCADGRVYQHDRRYRRREQPPRRNTDLASRNAQTRERDANACRRLQTRRGGT